MLITQITQIIKEDNMDNEYNQKYKSNGEIYELSPINILFLGEEATSPKVTIWVTGGGASATPPVWGHTKNLAESEHLASNTKCSPSARMIVRVLSEGVAEF